MSEYRNTLEYWKKYARKQLETNALVFERSLVRELSYLVKKHNIKDLEELTDVIQKELKVPANQQNVINDIVNRAQRKIKNVWDMEFARKNIYEQVEAYYSVNFAQLSKDYRKSLMSNLKKAIDEGLNYPQFRQKLLKMKITHHHAETLANTAVAQYDNGYMHEVCAQAGIEKFRYDGMYPERPFCKRHYRKIYTRNEIEMMDNGQGLPVMTAMGGYNCVHYWTPMFDEL